MCEGLRSPRAGLLCRSTLHLVSIVKPWKQPAVAKEKCFYQSFSSVPEERSPAASDDIMLADEALPPNQAAETVPPTEELFMGFHREQSRGAHVGPAPGSEWSADSPQLIPQIRYLSPTHQSHVHSFSSQNGDFERRRPAGQNYTDCRLISSEKLKGRGAVHPPGGWL